MAFPVALSWHLINLQVSNSCLAALSCASCPPCLSSSEARSNCSLNHASIILFASRGVSLVGPCLTSPVHFHVQRHVGEKCGMDGRAQWGGCCCRCAGRRGLRLAFAHPGNRPSETGNPFCSDFWCRRANRGSGTPWAVRHHPAACRLCAKCPTMRTELVSVEGRSGSFLFLPNAAMTAAQTLPDGLAYLEFESSPRDVSPSRFRPADERDGPSATPQMGCRMADGQCGTVSQER